MAKRKPKMMAGKAIGKAAQKIKMDLVNRTIEGFKPKKKRTRKTRPKAY